MTIQCAICLETTFNTTSERSGKGRFISNCCDLVVHKECVSAYLLQSGSAPQCFSCNTGYTHQQLESQFTKKFIGDLLLQQAALFKETEKAKLPATMALAQLHKEVAQARKELEPIDMEIQELQNRINQLRGSKVPLNRLIETKLRQIDHAMRDPNNEIPDELRTKDKEGRKFIAPCCYDDCNGFLSTQYKCGICDRFTCNLCLKGKAAHDDPDHVCNEADVQSVIEIKNNTKPCPKCGARIFKISGCSQMFCTQPSCGTVFDWNTLRIQTKGPEHNPHIHEWRTRHGVVNETTGCAVDITSYHLTTASRRMRSIDGEFIRRNVKLLDPLHSMIQKRDHIRHVTLGHLERDDERQNGKYTTLRIKFLNGEISEDQWTKDIKSMHKADLKRRDYMSIIQEVPPILNDLIRVQVENINNKQDLSLDQIHEFLELMEQSLQGLNNKYKVKGISLKR